MKSPIRSFFTTFTWRTGLVYGLALCMLSLLAWSAYRTQERQTGVNLDNLTMLSAIEGSMEREGEALNREIKRKEEQSASENSLHHGEALHYREALQIRNLQNNKIYLFEIQPGTIYPIYEKGLGTPIKDYGPANLTINHEAILQALISTADSLRFWAHGESAILQDIDTFLGQSQLQNYRTLLSNGSTLEQLMAIKIIRINYRNICNALLNRINAVLPKYDPRERCTFLPIMSVTESSKCLRVGDIFEADVFASYYPKNLNHLRARANGESIPIVAGIGRYSTVYRTPGVKKLVLEAICTNPLTEQVNTFRRDYSLEICR